MSDKRVAGSNPRVVRVAVLTAAALAAVIFAGGFVGPQKTLAFSPVPTAVTSSQLAAADAACRAPVVEKPFVMDDAATRKELGLKPTPWSAVLKATVGK